MRLRRGQGFWRAASVLVIGQVAGRRTTLGVLYFVVQKTTKRQRRARRNGDLAFLAQWIELSTSTRLVAGSNPALRTIRLNAKTRLGTYRKWLKAEAFPGNSAVRTAASCSDLGSAPHGWVAPIQSLAGLTVSKLLTRCVRRVNRLTPKKAVMTNYRHAGESRVAVDTRATVAMQAAGTPAKGWS